MAMPFQNTADFLQMDMSPYSDPSPRVGLPLRVTWETVASESVVDSEWLR